MLTARRNPAALASRPISTAITGNNRNADVGTTTRMGNTGTSTKDSRPPSTAASTATMTACRQSPASTERVDTPTALSTAKSRVRSKAER